MICYYTSQCPSQSQPATTTARPPYTRNPFLIAETTVAVVSRHRLHKVSQVEALLVLLVVPQLSEIVQPGLLARLS